MPSSALELEGCIALMFFYSKFTPTLYLRTKSYIFNRSIQVRAHWSLALKESLLNQ